MPNTYCMHANWCFQSKCSNISAEGLHFSAFHCVCTRIFIYIEDVRTKEVNECAVYNF